MSDTEPGLRLHLWRRLDWRFLLPSLEFDTVRVGGRIDAELREAVTLIAPDARELPRDGGSGCVDLVVLRFPSRADLRAAAAAVRPGGWVCVEVERSLVRSSEPSTLWGWRRAFRALGLRGVALYWFAPTLNAPSRIIDLDHRGAVRSTLARHQGMRFGALLSRTARLALTCGLLPLVVPAGVVVGQREGRGQSTSFIDAVLRAHQHELQLESWLPDGWETAHVTPRFVTSRHMVGLIFAAGEEVPRLVVKVPRQPGDNEGVRREAAILTALATRSDGAVPGVPDIVGILDVGDYSVLVETALRGDQLDPARVNADFGEAVRAGVGFLSSLPQTANPEQNQDWYERTVSRPLATLEAMAPLGGETAELVRRTHSVLAPLRPLALPAVVEHADLSHPNLLIDADGTLQVMDWERASLTGVPGHDLIFFLQYLSESTRNAYERTNQLDAFDAAFAAGGWALPIVQQQLRRRGVDERLAPLLVVATWARSAATLADRLAPEDETRAAPPHVQRVVTQDRDFWLWRHALAQIAAGRLVFDPNPAVYGRDGVDED